DEEPVADRLGTGGVVTKGGDERLRPTHWEQVNERGETPTQLFGRPEPDAPPCDWRHPGSPPVVSWSPGRGRRRRHRRRRGEPPLLRRPASWLRRGGHRPSPPPARPAPPAL